MKILFADADRDLLMCYRKILEMAGNEVFTVFDGAQVIDQITRQQFDLIILSDGIPRVRSRDIIRHLNEENIPVIVLLENKINSRILSDEVSANAYLTLPFLPKELLELVEAVMKKQNEEKTKHFERLSLSVSGFCLEGRKRLTNEEIDILEMIDQRQVINAKRAGIYINSLNHKLEALGKEIRIRYIMGEGYGLTCDSGNISKE